MKIEKYKAGDNKIEWDFDIKDDIITLKNVCLTLLESHPNLTEDTKHCLKCLLETK